MTQDGFFHISKHHPKYNNQNESEKNKSMPTSNVCVWGEENSFGEQNLCIIYALKSPQKTTTKKALQCQSCVVSPAPVLS